MEKQKLLFIEIVKTTRSSNIPKRYKRNAINADLHRSKRISTNFDQEIYRIKKKFLAPDYPQKFVESVVRNFENDQIRNVEDDYIIPPGLFDIVKPVIITEVPFCIKTEVSSKQFLQKFHNFTGNKFDLRIKWITRKTKSYFKSKDKCLHQAYKIYLGACSCGETYIGETITNVETRWNEHHLKAFD